jgi:hypothetical protein
MISGLSLFRKKLDGPIHPFPLPVQLTERCPAQPHKTSSIMSESLTKAEGRTAPADGEEVRLRRRLGLN